jgi:hypothetical protein
MAKQVQTTLHDDIDGGTKDVASYHIGLAGQWYEIDLSDINAGKLDPFFEVARPVDAAEVAAIYKAAKKRGASGQDIKHDKAEIAKAREWGKKNGYSVSKAGRLSKELWAAFETAA